MRVSFALALAACYSPQPQPGSPCDTGHPCPDPLVCSIAGVCAQPGTSPGDAPRQLDAPIDTGSVIDAPPGPSNDLPTGATVLTGSTTINEDITYAHDDAGPGTQTFCGMAGGRDVYFTLTNAYPQVWYFDTFGSSYDTVIRAYAGACVTGVPASTQICRNNQCGTMQSQLARAFDTGDWCIVVDEAVPGTGSATLVLNVEMGVHNGAPLATGTSTVSDDTCNGGSFWKGSCGGTGPEINYFTTSCPGVTTMLTATTCAATTTSDTILIVRSNTQELACNDNDTACTATTTGASTVSDVALTDAHLFWLTVDSAGATAPACGPFSLTTTLQ